MRKLYIFFILFLFFSNLCLAFKIQLIAKSKNYLDNYNYFGIKPGASDGYQDNEDIYDLPPLGNNYVWLYFYHDDWGIYNGSYNSDFRSENFTNSLWKVKLKWKNAPDTVKVFIIQNQSAPDDSFHLPISNDYTAVLYKDAEYYNLKTLEQLIVSNTSNGETMYYVRILKKSDIPYVKSFSIITPDTLFPTFLVEFNKDMKSSNFINNNIYLIKNSDNSCIYNLEFNYDSSNKKLYIQTKSQLEPNTSYKLVITDRVTDLYDNPLDGNHNEEYSYNDFFYGNFLTSNITLPQADIIPNGGEFFDNLQLNFNSQNTIDSIKIEIKNNNGNWEQLFNISGNNLPINLYIADSLRFVYLRWKIKSGNYWGNYKENSIPFLFDKIPPKTSSDYDGLWKKEAFIINLIPNDGNGSGFNGSGKTFYKFRANNFVEGKQVYIDGNFVDTLFYYSIDDVGNIESVKYDIVKIDKIKPYCVNSEFPDYNISNNANYNFSITVNDSLSGIKQVLCKYRLNVIPDTFEVIMTRNNNTFTGEILKPNGGWVQWQNFDIIFSFVIEDSAGNKLNLNDFYIEKIEYINVAPIFTEENLNLIVKEGEIFNYQLVAEDINNDLLTFSAENLPENSILNSETGYFQWFIKFNQSNNFYNSKFFVSDGALKDTLRINFTVIDSIPKVNFVYPVDNQTLFEPENNFIFKVNSFKTPIYNSNEIKYKLQIFDNNFQNIIFENTSNDTVFYIPKNLLQQNYYYHSKITLIIENIEYGSNSIRFFTDDYPEAPLSFALISPINNAVFEGGNINFSWHKAIDPDQNDSVNYLLLFSETSEFNTIYFQESVADTFITIAYDDLYSNKTDSLKLYWKVIAEDNNNLSTESEIRSIKLYNFSEDIIQLQFPQNNSIINSLNINFRWYTSSVLLHYQLKIINKSDNSILNIDNIENNQFNLINNEFIEDNTEYEWFIIGTSDNKRITIYSDTLRFYVDIPEAPGDFSLIYPANNSLLDSDIIEFRWSKANDYDLNDNVSYEIFFSLDPSFTNIKYHTTTNDTLITINTNIFFSDKVDSLTLYWKVIAKDSYLFSTTSEEIFSFKLFNYSDEQIINLLPVNNQVINTPVVKFKWSSSNSFASYNLKITNRTTQEVLNIAGIQGTEYTLNNNEFLFLIDDCNYQWSVAAISPLGNEVLSSQINYFSTYFPESPGNFSIISPINNFQVTNNGNVIIKWSKALDPDPADIVKYTVYIDTTSLFTNPIINSANTDTTFSFLPTMEQITYYIKVKAVDNFGLFSWSSNIGSFNYNPTEIEQNEIIKNLDLNVYPNPITNSILNLSYSLPNSDYVEIRIFNILGQEIKNIYSGTKNAGRYYISWENKNLNSGVYFVSLKTKKSQIIKKVIWVK